MEDQRRKHELFRTKKEGKKTILHNRGEGGTVGCMSLFLLCFGAVLRFRNYYSLGFARRGFWAKFSGCYTMGGFAVYSKIFSSFAKKVKCLSPDNRVM